MTYLKISFLRFLMGVAVCLGLTIPNIAHATTVAQVCATAGNSCVAGSATINGATAVTCGSVLDFAAAGFPNVTVGSAGSLELDPGVACSMTITVGNLLVQSGGEISADRQVSEPPGEITVNASGAITVQPGGEITAIGGAGLPNPTIELFAVGDVNIAGRVEARGTGGSGFGGHITIESLDRMVIVAGSGIVRAGSQNSGGTQVIIRACLGIEIAGVVDATARKRGAEIQLFSREGVRIIGGDLIADAVVGDLQPGDVRRIVIEARDDVIVSNNSLISSNVGGENKVAGTIDVLSTEGAFTCTASRILANALRHRSRGGVINLRSRETVTPSCTIQARGHIGNGFGGSILIQSFAQDILGGANASATGGVPGTITLRACANPITNGGTYNPPAVLNPGQCVAAPLVITPCGTPLPNQCPVITVPGGTVKAVQVGQTLSFAVSATDPNGGTTTLVASNLPANSVFIPNPSIGTPTASGVFSFTPTAAQVNQVFNVVFTAADNQGCSGAGAATVTVQITVTAGPPANQCPNITVAGGLVKTVQVGQLLSFAVSATDPNGGTTTLTATGLPTGSSFSPNPATGTPTASGVFSFTPTAGQANQVFNVVFTASDNQGCSGAGAAKVTVLISVTSGPGPVCQPPTGSSSAFGVDVDLNILPLLGMGINVSVGPVPMSMASGPPVSVDSDQLASLSVAIPLTGNILSTGILDTFAAVNLPTTQNADALARVVNPDLDVVGDVLLPLLGLNATVIQSDAHVAGVCGTSLTGLGQTTIANAVGSGLLAGVTIQSNPPPNTILLDIPNVLRITLNEQIPTGNGVNSRGLTVNAIHIELDAVNLTSLLGINLGLVTGDIIISQSQAQLQCACM